MARGSPEGSGADTDVSVSWAERQRIVSARAGQRCEYCRMHQELQGAVFHVEHLVAALNLNHERRVRIRHVEARFGLFSPV